MRKEFLAAILVVSGSAATLAQSQLQALNVKTGLWQITEVSTATGGIPPEMQARLDALPPQQRAALQQVLQSRLGGTPRTTTYTNCITQADLQKMPFQGPNDHCTWTILTSSATDMSVQGTACQGDNGRGVGQAKIQIHAIDSGNATGSVQVTFTDGGQNVNTNATLTGKWVSATCTK